MGNDTILGGGGGGGRERGGGSKIFGEAGKQEIFDLWFVQDHVFTINFNKMNINT